MVEAQKPTNLDLQAAMNSQLSHHAGTAQPPLPFPCLIQQGTALSRL